MLYFKINNQNRVYYIFFSDEIPEDAFLLIDNNQDVMWALYENDQFIFDEEYYNFHKEESSYTKQDVSNAIQSKLDQQAQQYNFDSMLSAASYVNSSVTRFREEAIALSSWRDQVWAWAYQKEEDIISGKIPKPATIEEALSDMPAFIPPAPATN